jgi:murein DD-endopeptidase MepM/ murein hydrolase activator NlpD
MKFNRFFIKIIAPLTRAAEQFFSIFLNFLAVFFLPIKKAGALAFRFFIFPPYKAFYFLRYRFLRSNPSSHSRVFSFLNKNYVIHILVAIIGGAVLAGNLNAQELRDENYGEKTLIYSLISKEEYEELTEEGLLQPQDKDVSYLDQGVSLGLNDMPVDGADTEPPQDLLSVTHGGLALLKPNIIQPVTPGEITGTAVERRDGIIVYTVQPGETISTIASRFAISLETILWQNNLSSRSVIRPGQTLEILPVSGIAHKVARNETVSSIAKKYKVDESEIVRQNNLMDVSDIKISQVLIVPGGKKIYPTVAVAKKTGNVPAVSSITKLFVPPTGEVSRTTPLLWPTAARVITQYYKLGHLGLDVGGPTGTAIYAADDGVVEISGWQNGYGNTILLRHNDGSKTRYGHFSKLYVAKGETVTRGQTLGAMGSTGWSTGPHLHFEVIVGGKKKNPLSYIR